MKTLARLLAFAAALALPVGNAAAQPAKAPVTDALDLRCGDLTLALRIADPGKNPTKKRQQQAKEAQDDVASGLYWIHGYRTATLGDKAPALTPKWMEQELKSVVAACKARSPDGNMTLLQIVRS